MNRSEANDLDLAISRARIGLSIVALLSWYVDPSHGGWFFMDEPSMILLGLHLVYSVGAYLALCGNIAPARLAIATTCLDLVFAAAVTVITEGETSPSWLFFLYAIIAVDCRTGFRPAVAVTLSSSALYMLLLAIFSPGPNHVYLMRPVYLALVGYLVGFFGQQRAIFEARVRHLETAAERHAIARSLHDGYIQALAGVNLRLETCRTLVQRQRLAETYSELTELQTSVTREYDSVRSYIRSLADVEHDPQRKPASPGIETRFEINVAFVARGLIVEHIIQIMLEGMRNAWQHGKASVASIRVSEGDGAVRIAIDDDGVGFRDSDTAPWAIASRVAEYGGRLKIAATAGSGAHLVVELPTS